MTRPAGRCHLGATCTQRSSLLGATWAAPDTRFKTAGASGDSPAMISASLSAASELVTYIPVVDAAAVAICHDVGPGARVDLCVGASIDKRWSKPVALEGLSAQGGLRLIAAGGCVLTGMEVSMGKFATVAAGSIRLLLREGVAWTSDTAIFRFAELPPEIADVIVVRSCSDFRPNFPEAEQEAATCPGLRPQTWPIFDSR